MPKELVESTAKVRLRRDPASEVAADRIEHMDLPVAEEAAGVAAVSEAD